MAGADVLDQVTIDVDLTEVPVCEFGNCDQPAEWVAVLSVCRHQILCCTPHHDRVVEQEPIAMERGGWYHEDCPATGSRVLWRRL